MKHVTFFICGFILGAVLCSAALSGGEDTQTAYLIPIHGVIDLGLSSYVARVSAEAQEAGADLVIFDIDTFGGRVDAATEICDTIAQLDPIPTIAFVSGEAWSAGALISLACDTIIMSPGSSIGSAEPRGGAVAGDELTDEKMVSAIRAKFKAVAEKNGHSVNLAQAMVDKDIELKIVKTGDTIEILTVEEWEAKPKRYRKKMKPRVLVAKGKLLNLTAEEAKELRLAQEIVGTTPEVLRSAAMPEARVMKSAMNWSEGLVRFITHPIVSSLLLTIGFLGLIFELRMPGWGVSGTVGLISLCLFFWGHYLVGLANWLEVVLFLLGIGLVALEIFVIPGFGVAGISGIVLILVSLFLALVKHPFDVPRRELIGAFYIIGYAFIFSVLIAFLFLRWLPRSRFWQKLVLVHKEETTAGYTQTSQWDKYLGRQGITVTPLRPTGKVEVAGQILDVVTEGDFLDQGTTVEITSIDGNRIVVRGVYA